MTSSSRSSSILLNGNDHGVRDAVTSLNAAVHESHCKVYKQLDNKDL